MGNDGLMKFILGLIIGAAASGYIVNNMSADQRNTLEAKIDKGMTKVKDSKVSESVKGNVSQVASDATDVVTDKIDAAGDTVSSKIPNSGS